MFVAAPAVAQRGEDRANWEGNHFLRFILHSHDLKPTTRVDDLTDSPSTTLLIALGDLNVLQQIPGGLKNYLDRGGAVLLASDRGVFDEVRAQLTDLVGHSPAGVPIVYDGRNPNEDTFRGMNDCPLVTPVGGARPDLFRPSGADPSPLSVATNEPGWLQRQVAPAAMPDGVRVLAQFPAGMAVEGGRRQWFRERPTFAVGGESGRGKILVLADHSVFINEMMLHRDNFHFACNCVEWLRGEGNKRRVAMLIDDRGVASTFDVPLRQSPPVDLWGNLQKIINAGILDAKLHQLETETPGGLSGLGLRALQAGLGDLEQQRLDIPWRWLVAAFSPRNLGYTAVVLLALVALIYAFIRIGTTGRHQPEPGLPTLSRALERQAPTGSLAEQRQEVVLETGQYAEAGRDLARRWFDRVLGSGARSGPPEVEALGSGRQRRDFGRLVGRLWKLAYGAVVQPVDARRLKALLAECGRLNRALADGQLRLHVHGSLPT